MRDFARAVATCLPLLLLASCRAFAPTAGPGRPEGPTMTVLAAVRDQAGTPLEDAVVTATALDLQPSPAERPPALVTIENYAFKPAVLPVRVGTAVSFRNRDGIDHHIYSISPAKRLDQVVTRLTTSDPVLFERAGVVVVGSATHDSSVGHLYVVETPHFATTGPDGRAQLAGLTPGTYVVQAWHPGLKGAAPQRVVADTPSRRAGVDFTVTVERGPAPPGLPASLPQGRPD